MFALLLLAAVTGLPICTINNVPLTAADEAALAAKEVALEPRDAAVFYAIAAGGFEHPFGFSDADVFPSEKVAAAWYDCAFDGLGSIAANKVDPVGSLAAAVVDGCTEARDYQSAIQTIWRTTLRPDAEARQFFEQQRTNFVRSMTAELVRRRALPEHP